MMLISPRSTLISCGRASIRVYRRNEPTRAISIAHAAVEWPGWRTIVRNTHSLKRRPPRPMHSWRSKTGPGPSNLSASATRSRRGKVKASNILAITISVRSLDRSIESCCWNRDHFAGIGIICPIFSVFLVNMETVFNLQVTSRGRNFRSDRLSRIRETSDEHIHPQLGVGKSELQCCGMS